MLELRIKEDDLWDETNEQFIHVPETRLTLEHSLLSIAKWEGIYKKPLLRALSEEEYALTPMEMIGYMKCMTIGKSVPDEVYYGLSADDIKKFHEYLENVPTATWFREDEEDKPKGKPRILTAELIYCWMINARIPKEYEKWNINRLMVLLRVLGEENKSTDKPKKVDMNRRRADMERARRRFNKHK